MPDKIAGDSWRVFLSSTFRELETYRRAVRERCAQEFNDRIDLVALDDDEYTRAPLDAKMLSAEKVKTCDLVVLLIGRGLGSRTDDGESFTEVEIRAARENGIRVRGFRLNEDAQGISAHPSQEDQQRWDEERVKLFSDRVDNHDKLVGWPEVSLGTPDQLAAEVVKVLREWLDFWARPHSLRETNKPDLIFVDREVPYRALKGRVLQELDSVLSGPSGIGKSTITKALCADHDVARKYAVPVIELSVDFSVPGAAEAFRAEADERLVPSTENSPGRRPLLLVTMSAVLAQRTQQDSSQRVMAFIRSAFSSDNPLPQPCTIVFEVPETRAAGLICRHFDLGPEANISVPPLSPADAVDLLLTHKGMHNYPCLDCEQLAPGVATAAGYWPPLLAVCARSIYEEKTPQAKHDYMQHAVEAFGHLTGEERMYATYRDQVERLPKQAQVLLRAAGVLLPKPFTFSPDLIQKVSGLSKEATRRELQTLDYREFIERVDYPERADGSREYAYTVHPFFWVFLERAQHEAAARRKTQKLRSAAFSWLEQKVDETVDDLSYRGWFELESPERQSLIANWIYQLAHLDDRPRAAEELTRVFLKALWWWGCYLPFSFCDLLVELGNKAVDWSSPSPGDDLLTVVDAIQRLNKWFPRFGYFDNPPAASQARKDWQKIEKALGDIVAQLQIPVTGDEATELIRAEAGANKAEIRRLRVRREIAMYLHVFLSECRVGLFGERALDAPALREVERHCEAALALAEKLEDSWNQPWLGTELGDAELDAAKARRQSAAASGRTEAAALEEAQARAQTARTLAVKALKLAEERGKAEPDELDFEVMSVCERLLGDIDWFEGSQDAAARHYARAIHYAHCFELWPEDHPDDYTRTFEREQRWRVSMPLVELAQEGGDQTVLRAVCGDIATFLGTDPDAAFDGVIKAAAAPESRRPGAAVSGLFAPYRLPPGDELQRRTRADHDMIDKFRSQATQMIRSTELRRPEDEDLVHLPEDFNPL